MTCKLRMVGRQGRKIFCWSSSSRFPFSRFEDLLSFFYHRGCNIFCSSTSSRNHLSHRATLEIAVDEKVLSQQSSHHDHHHHSHFNFKHLSHGNFHHLLMITTTILMLTSRLEQGSCWQRSKVASSQFFIRASSPYIRSAARDDKSGQLDMMDMLEKKTQLKRVCTDKMTVFF